MLAETLKDVNDYNKGRKTSTPREYVEIKKRFREAMENQTPILVENNRFKSPYSVKLYIHYVGDRWCLGKVRYLHMGKEVLIPHTIHYGDIYSKDSTSTSAKNMTILFKGGNPFGTGLREGTEEDS